MDRIDQLIDILNREITDISFDRDAIDVDRPDEWGAVELRRESNIWADGHPVDSITRADVFLCVNGRESDWAEKMRDAFLCFDDEVEDIGWTLSDRTYLPELDRLLWKWAVVIYGPLDVPAPPEAPAEPEEPEEEPEEPGEGGE